MITQTLTAKELNALRVICKYAGNGGNDLKTLNYYLSDLYTWFEPHDLLQAGAFASKQELGGYLSSLEAKGMILVNEDGRSITREGIEYLIANYPTTI